MARFAFENSLAVGAPPQPGWGWKQLFWLAVAFAGLGFAGYVYVVPYQKMQHAVGTRQAELKSERAAAEQATSERDKLKATVDKYVAADKDKVDVEAKRKETADALALAVKTGMEELGARVTADGTKLLVSFPAAKVVAANELDLSDAGQTAMKALSEVAKKEDAKIRVVARTSSAAPPKALRKLFHTRGEMWAVRAAHVMLTLEAAGLPPAQVGIVGEVAEKAARHGHGRGRKAAAPPDHLELQVGAE